MLRFAFVLAFSFALVAGISARAEETFPVDEEGFVKNWLLLAPIPLDDGMSGADGIDKEFIKDEGKLTPKEGEKVKVGAKELTWKKIKAADYYFDVNDLLGDRFDNVACYAVCYIVADADMKATLQMSSNDQGKTWLNGKEVAKNTEGRTIDKDQTAAKDVALTKGVNVVVHKVVNESNNWQGALRFTDAAGKGIKTLKVQLAK
jgi:hypothetical protein